MRQFEEDSNGLNPSEEEEQRKRTQQSLSYASSSNDEIRQLYKNLEHSFGVEAGPKIRKQLVDLCHDWISEHVVSQREGRPTVTVSTTFEVSISPEKKFTVSRIHTVGNAAVTDDGCGEADQMESEERQKESLGRINDDRNGRACSQAFLPTPEGTPQRCTSEDKEISVMGSNGNVSQLDSAHRSDRVANVEMSFPHRDADPSHWSPLPRIDPALTAARGGESRRRTLSNTAFSTQMTHQNKRIKLNSNSTALQSAQHTTAITAASPGPASPDEKCIVQFLKCFKCSDWLENEAELKEHLLTMHATTEHYCPVARCHLQSFQSDGELDRHMRTMHTRQLNDNDWHCCGENFSTKKLLDFQTHHRLVHTIRCFFCPLDGCTFSDTTRDSVLKHWNQSHEHSPRNGCRIEAQCSETLRFCTPSVDSAHEKLSKNYTITKLHCFVEKCSESVPTLNQLEKHLRTVHDKSTMHIECPVCHLWFNKSEVLLQHLDDAHKGASGPWTCRICQQQIDRESLGKHFRQNHIMGDFECAYEYPISNRSRIWCTFKANTLATIIDHYDQAHGIQGNDDEDSE